jgi:hypothetical protein
MKWIAAIGRAEDCAAEVSDTTDGIFREGHDLVFPHETRKSALDAENLPTAIDGGEDGGTDDGVEPGSVSATSRNRNSHCEEKLTSRFFARLQQSHDLTRLGVTVELGFFKNWNPIRDDLESPAARFDERDARTGKPLTKLGRQTGGPRFVVSHLAVFNSDVHSFLALETRR